MTLSQTVQLVQVAAYLAAIAVFLIAAYWIRPWLLAHHAQVQVATEGIANATIRAWAEDCVRYAEQSPETWLKPGLEQRAAAIARLMSLAGINNAMAEVAIDSAFSGLKAAGQIAATAQAQTPAAGTALNRRADDLPATGTAGAPPAQPTPTPPATSSISAS